MTCVYGLVERWVRPQNAPLGSSTKLVFSGGGGNHGERPPPIGLQVLDRARGDLEEATVEGQTLSFPEV